MLRNSRIKAPQKLWADNVLWRHFYRRYLFHWAPQGTLKMSDLMFLLPPHPRTGLLTAVHPNPSFPKDKELTPTCECPWVACLSIFRSLLLWGQLTSSLCPLLSCRLDQSRGLVSVISPLSRLSSIHLLLPGLDLNSSLPN